MKKILLFVFLCFKCFAYEALDEGIYIQRNIPKDSAGLKIAMITVIIDYERDFSNMVSFGTRSKEIYAAKHGYDFIIGTAWLGTCFGVKPKRPLEVAWTKLAVISRFIDQYDWVFWTDADSVILDFDCKLEKFIDERYDVIACTEDVNFSKTTTYNYDVEINSGQVFYKNSDIAKQIVLGAWINHGEMTRNSWDQARINKYIKDNLLFDNVLVHKPKDFNVNPKQYEKGDFLVHMYGFHKFHNMPLGWDNLQDAMNDYEEKYGYLLDIEKQKLLNNGIEVNHYKRMCSLIGYVNN